MNSFHSEGNTHPEGENRIFQDLLHQALMHLAQSKLYFCRAIRALQSDRPRARRVLESLAAGLQIAIKSAQRVGVRR